MSNNFFKYLILAGCLSQMATAFAGRGYDDCCEPSCCERVYDCGDPLNCGSLNFWVRAGVAPTIWRDRGDFSLVSCNGLAAGQDSTIVTLFELPKFSKFFKTPWIIGGQIGYAVTDCMEFYLEANYRKANHKKFVISDVAIPNDTLTVTFLFDDGYRAVDAYAGARYYWGRCWCDKLAWFLGGKFGLVHRQEVDFDFSLAQEICVVGAPLESRNSVPFFYRSTSPSVGLNFGLDWCWGCGWSFMFMAEVVATCGPKSNDNIVIANNCSQLPLLNPSNIIIGHIGTEIFFPITFGVKYSF